MQGAQRTFIISPAVHFRIICKELKGRSKSPQQSISELYVRGLKDVQNLPSSPFQNYMQRAQRTFIISPAVHFRIICKGLKGRSKSPQQSISELYARGSKDVQNLPSSPFQNYMQGVQSTFIIFPAVHFRII